MNPNLPFNDFAHNIPWEDGPPDSPPFTPTKKEIPSETVGEGSGVLGGSSQLVSR